MQSTDYQIALTDKSEIEASLERIRGLVQGETCSYNPRLLTSRLREIADGYADDLKEPCHEFRDFLTRNRLDDNKPLFTSFHQVGKALARLPRAHYRRQQTVATELWYICGKEPRPVPDIMANEIVRCLTCLYGTRLNGNFKKVVDEFEVVVARHNDLVKKRQLERHQALATPK